MDLDLICASRAGNLDAVVDCLNNGANPLAYSSAALRAACLADHTAVALHLLPLSDPLHNGSEALRNALVNKNTVLTDTLWPLSDRKLSAIAALKFDRLDLVDSVLHNDQPLDNVFALQMFKKCTETHFGPNPMLSKIVCTLLQHISGEQIVACFPAYPRRDHPCNGIEVVKILAACLQDPQGYLLENLYTSGYTLHVRELVCGKYWQQVCLQYKQKRGSYILESMLSECDPLACSIIANDPDCSVEPSALITALCLPDKSLFHLIYPESGGPNALEQVLWYLAENHPSELMWLCKNVDGINCVSAVVGLADHRNEEDVLWLLQRCSPQDVRRVLSEYQEIGYVSDETVGFLEKMLNMSQRAVLNNKILCQKNICSQSQPRKI